MSGTGKSSVIRELAARGYRAVDADEAGVTSSASAVVIGGRIVGSARANIVLPDLGGSLTNEYGTERPISVYASEPAGWSQGHGRPTPLPRLLVKEQGFATRQEHGRPDPLRPPRGDRCPVADAKPHNPEANVNSSDQPHSRHCWVNGPPLLS